MANFKLAKKDALSDTRSNIYDLHDKKLEYFEQEKKNLNNYILKLNNLKKKYEIDKSRSIFEKINELELKIENISNDTDLNDYLLEFFSLINNFEDSKDSETTKKGLLDNFVNYKINNSKIELYNEYIKRFNPELKEIKVSINELNYCIICKNNEFTYDQKTADEICTSCGCAKNIVTFEDNNGNNYCENVEQVIVFNYERRNHFQECLNQLQAKENTTIPPKIIQELTIEFKKYNITDPKLFTPTLVKSYLKKLKYNKYYEHIPTIINEFCGLRAPKMTPELEQQLKIMFDEIQLPFEKYSKIICKDRKNFLNYNYVFYKMCELLNKDEFLSCFPLLKNREILYQHDLIWKGICNELKWEFIPSI
jgi:hypothetical protein